MSDMFGFGKITIGMQIEEVERELTQRASVYPRLVANKKLSQTKADYHVARMKAVLTTLEWLRDNEAAIKAKVP